mgnify:CR=1 FL=1
MQHFSACMKLILAGEHLVLKGYRGLAIPLKQYQTHITTEPAAEFRLITDYFPEYILGELANIASDLEIPLPNATYKIVFDIRPGIGLGASASFAIASLKALTKNQINQDDLIKFANISESRSHGKASGLDHLTIIRQQPTILNSNISITSDLSILNNIEIIDTGVPKESTADMVEISMRNFNETTWENIDKNFEPMIDAINNNYLNSFRNYINEYGLFLEELGVVSEKVKAQSKKLREKGFGVKICGAGGITNGSGALMII